MNSTTSAEFNPTYFKSIMGEFPEEWREFVAVNVRTFSEGFDKLKAASDAGDMEVVSDVRHALSPSLQQWGTVTLDTQLMALESADLLEHWKAIEPEFKTLLTALKALT